MPRNSESARPASPAPPSSRVGSNSTPPFDPNLTNTATTNVSQPVDRQTNALPKVGETRCCKSLSLFPYDRSIDSIDRSFDQCRQFSVLDFFPPIDWALLSADLNFLYLDPVLQSHLAEQAELLIGKTLINFVHPDEQKSAKQDLGSVLESRTLHGSVTRWVFALPNPPLFSSSALRNRPLTPLLFSGCDFPAFPESGGNSVSVVPPQPSRMWKRSPWTKITWRSTS